MGFHFITGIMGGGKSYYGSELCLECLQEGGIVHTNLPLKWDEVNRLGYQDRIVKLPEDPSSWVRKEKDANGKSRWVSDILVMGKEGAENLVVADEASLMWSADNQMKDKEKNEPLFGLVALSRHAGLDIYFLAQREGHVAKKLRDLADTRTHCVNSSRIPLVGWFCKRVFGDFKRIIFRGNDPKPYGHYWVRFRKSVGDFYHTHGMRDDLGMKTGGTRVRKSNAIQNKGIALVIFGIALPVAVAVLLIWRTFDGMKPDEKTEEKKLDNEKSVFVDIVKPHEFKKEDIVPVWYGLGAKINEKDEHILASVTSYPSKTVVYARGGLRFTIGSAYEGQTIVAMIPTAGAWYFLTDQDRVVLVRPIRYDERKLLPPLTINGSKSQDGKELEPQEFRNSITELVDKLNVPIPTNSVEPPTSPTQISDQ